MATVQSNTIYNYLRSILFGNVPGTTVDFDADTFKMGLLGAGYTPDFVNHHFWSDISASEIAAGNGYTAGGVQLTGTSVSADGAGLKFTSTGPTPLWTASGAGMPASRYAVIYKSTGVAATSPLVCCLLLAVADQVTVSAGSTLNLTPDATHGWLNIA